MQKLAATLKRRVADEAGAALVVVLALSITMLILITAALSFSLSGMKTAYADVDNTAALAAAYAGIDEYRSRLSNDSQYQRYGNPAAPFTVATRIGTDDTVTLPIGSDENPAFGIGEAGTWATVPGTDGRASFRYEVDNSQHTSTGVVRVRSTGRVGNKTRSVVADLRQNGFIDFLYFSKYEVMDPDISNTNCTESNWLAKKVGNTISHGSSCTEIRFGLNDVLDGRVHSNDILMVCGATFKRGVTTSTKITSPEYHHACGTDGIFLDPSNAGGVIPRVPDMNMPPTNNEMKSEARLDVPAVENPGCMYTGPTQITFKSNGEVNVVSPWTKFTRVSLTQPADSRNDAECGDIGDLNSSTGATFTPPAQNLIYVQDVPNDKNDPNYSKKSNRPAGFTCSNSGKSTEGWRYRQPASSSYPTVRYPLYNERRPRESTTNHPAYGCTNGDAFVEGTVSGEITVASSNYIYVTDDLEYADPAADVLGLVGNNAVWVWNPMSNSNSGQGCSGGYCPMKAEDRTIDAAILSVRHTFQVQNYAVGTDRGLLTVNGAIAQKFRGTVGTTGNTGYAKSYNYDSRLFVVSPPKFLLPTATTYKATKYASVRTAFDADGATIP